MTSRGVQLRGVQQEAIAAGGPVALQPKPVSSKVLEPYFFSIFAPMAAPNQMSVGVVHTTQETFVNH
jgi:hypothetical protein